MGIFFGTDGIRGKVSSGLNHDIAFRCANALASEKPNAKILIGQDTRLSCNYLTLAFSLGAVSAGANVTNIGVCPTAGVAYLCKKYNFDYGVVISASHNPPEYNGIKIFNSEGYKLNDNQEMELESKFLNTKINNHPNFGTYKQNFSLVKKYEDFLLKSTNVNLNGLKIVIDASNGASYSIAPKVLKRLGAKVIKTNCKNNGLKINENCGCLHPKILGEKVKKYKANLGFAFDGDSDRIIACNKFGEEIDGDVLIYILAKYLKQNNQLNNNAVVGTKHTNMGIEKALSDLNIKLYRADIGDKYVIEKINEHNLSLGGEKSGHIILKNIATTGDGILSAIKICEVIKNLKTPLEELSSVKLYPQVNLNILVNDKSKILNSNILEKEIKNQEKYLGKNSRVLVRASGTEPKIRIMTECEDITKAQLSANKIKQVVEKLNG